MRYEGLVSTLGRGNTHTNGIDRPLKRRAENFAQFYQDFVRWLKVYTWPSYGVVWLAASFRWG